MSRMNETEVESDSRYYIEYFLILYFSKFLFNEHHFKNNV